MSFNRLGERRIMTDLNKIQERPTETTIHTRQVSPSEIAYRDGYVQGRLSEQHYQYQAHQAQAQRARETENAFNGFLLGMLLTAIVGLGVGAFFLFAKPGTENPLRDTVPAPSPSASEPQKQADRQTTIIEKTIDKVREVVPTAPPQIQIPPIKTTSPSPNAQDTPRTAPDSNAGQSQRGLDRQNQPTGGQPTASEAPSLVTPSPSPGSASGSP
jgi:hypothetical protein